jgi:hypothetical protein
LQWGLLLDSYCTKPGTTSLSGGRNTNYVRTSKREMRMVKWQIMVVMGGTVLMQKEKYLPKNVLPPTYINCNNNANFLPLVGEFERTLVTEDDFENKVVYEKIDQFFGGK